MPLDHRPEPEKETRCENSRDQHGCNYTKVVQKSETGATLFSSENHKDSHIVLVDFPNGSISNLRHIKIQIDGTVTLYGHTNHKGKIDTKTATNIRNAISKADESGGNTKEEFDKKRDLHNAIAEAISQNEISAEALNKIGDATNALSGVANAPMTSTKTKQR